MAPRTLRRVGLLLVVLGPASLFFTSRSLARTYLFPSLRSQQPVERLEARQQSDAKYDGSHQGGRVSAAASSELFEASTDAFTSAELLRLQQGVREDGATRVDHGKDFQRHKHDNGIKYQRLVQEYFASQKRWNWSWPTHSMAYKAAFALREVPQPALTDTRDTARQAHVASLLNAKHLRPFPLDAVRLQPGSPHYDAVLKNGEYLLNILDADKLLASFRLTAGLQPKKEPYCTGGLSFDKAPGYCWEAPDCELRGHFLGHYLSALSIHALTMHSREARLKAAYIVSELAHVQQAISRSAFATTEDTQSQSDKKEGFSPVPTYGFVSAFPESHLTRFEDMKGVWAPVYTLHKIMQGLLDAHTLLGSVDALRVLQGMANHLVSRVDFLVSRKGVPYWYEQATAFFKNWFTGETGGMNELALRLFTVTGDPAHLRLAVYFEHPNFMQKLVAGEEALTGRHANYHIPVVVGAALRYEMFGEDYVREATDGFTSLLRQSRLYSTGGTSAKEYWGHPHDLGKGLGHETEESCTTHNLLKLTSHLFKWAPTDPFTMEWHESLVLNGVLSTQAGPGELLYTLPLGEAVSKGWSGHGWGRPDASFWCCYGSLVERIAKLSDGIFWRDVEPSRSLSDTEGDIPVVYVNSIVSASASWEDEGVEVLLTGELLGRCPKSQDAVHAGEYVSCSTANISVRHTGALGPGGTQRHTKLELRIRIPMWVAGTPVVSLNGSPYHCYPGEYCSIVNEWESADLVRVVLAHGVRKQTLDAAGGGRAADLQMPPALSSVLIGPFVTVPILMGGEVASVRIPKGRSLNAMVDFVPQSLSGKRAREQRMNTLIRSPFITNRYGAEQGKGPRIPRPDDSVFLWSLDGELAVQHTGGFTLFTPREEGSCFLWGDAEDLQQSNVWLHAAPLDGPRTRVASSSSSQTFFWRQPLSSGWPRLNSLDRRAGGPDVKFQEAHDSCHEYVSLESYDLPGFYITHDASTTRVWLKQLSVADDGIEPTQEEEEEFRAATWCLQTPEQAAAAMGVAVHEMRLQGSIDGYALRPVDRTGKPISRLFARMRRQSYRRSEDAAGPLSPCCEGQPRNMEQTECRKHTKNGLACQRFVGALSEGCAKLCGACDSMYTALRVEWNWFGSDEEEVGWSARGLSGSSRKESASEAYRTSLFRFADAPTGDVFRLRRTPGSCLGSAEHGCRDYLLMPIHEVENEQYSAYFSVAEQA